MRHELVCAVAVALLVACAGTVSAHRLTRSHDPASGLSISTLSETAHLMESITNAVRPEGGPAAMSCGACEFVVQLLCQFSAQHTRPLRQSRAVDCALSTDLTAVGLCPLSCAL
jgi:hypothetical protein